MAGIAASLPVLAQGKPAKVGILVARPLAESNYVPAILRRLEELGYRDGESMTLVGRSTDGISERYPVLARELLEQNCDVVISLGILAARALRSAGSAIPVVFLATEGDPVKAGLVSDLRRPDGNNTGVYIPQEAMVAKRMEILREAVPVRRALVLADQLDKHLLQQARSSAELLKLQLTITEFSRAPYDYQGAFDAARKASVQALIMLGSGVFSTDRRVIGALLTTHRLPSIGLSVQQAEAGFLLSFSANHVKAARRVAELAVQVLKGSKPADIPVEQADEFELLINGKTAKSLGISMPQSILARATRIVS